jgi:hypothetical protein
MAVPVFLVWASDEGYRGNDIHLVRSATATSSSAGLEPYLRLRLDDGTEVPLPKGPGGAVVFFTFSVPSPPESYKTRYGFTPHLDTGVVDLATAPTDKVVSNFIITANATDTGAVDETGSPRTLRALIRIHIHEGRAANGVMVQPNPLHLRKGTALRLSVLVQFSDGVLGDVSFHPGLTWSPSLALTVGGDPHSSAADKERAYKDGGFISPVSGPFGTTGTVKVDLPANLGGPTAPGDGEGAVTIIEAWDNLPPPPAPLVGDPYEAEYIKASKNGPGIEKRTLPEVRNVLFLPEGFLDAEQDEFNRMTYLFAAAMSTLPAFRPFDVLGFNFFRLWVRPYNDPPPAAPQRAGVTELEELYAQPSGTDFRGWTLPSTAPIATRTLSTAVKKSKADALVDDVVSQLLYMVGLPVTVKADLTSQLAEWTRIYSTDGTPYLAFNNSVPVALRPKVFDAWKRLKGRGLMLETDTLFQLASGGRQTLDFKPGVTNLKFHPLRYTREDLDPFIRKIFVKDAKGNQVPIGDDLWVKFDSPSVNLVYFVVRGQRDAGQSKESGKLPPVDPAHPEKLRLQRRTVAVTLTDATDPLLQEAFQNGFPITKVEPLSTDSKVRTKEVAVAVHELTHSFFVGDEYGGLNAVSGPTDTAFTATNWNLQTAAEVGGTTATGPVQSAKVRWNWPRVTSAVITTSVLSPTDTVSNPKNFSVVLQKGHLGEFGDGELVRYRRRALLTSTTPGGILQFRQPAALFEVTGRDSTKNTLKLLLKDPAPSAFVNDLVAGDVMYAPRRTPAGTDEFIVHPDILSFMASNGVLTRKSSDCKSGSGSEDGFQMPRGDLPSNLRYPSTKSSVIGLYDGGVARQCGIYHPTGRCMMRKQTWVRAQGGHPQITPLCHVCRYIVVDSVDPRRHDGIDGIFAPVTKK